MARHQVFLGLGIAILVQAALVKSGTTYQCKDHDIKVTEEDTAKMKKCGEAIGVKTMEEITPEKIPCFAKCIMESSELIDEQGKPHKENILKGIDDKIDAAVKDEYKAAIEKCIDEHGHHIRPADPTCLSYSAMAMCTAKAFKTICKG